MKLLNTCFDFKSVSNNNQLCGGLNTHPKSCYAVRGYKAKGVKRALTFEIHSSNFASTEIVSVLEDERGHLIDGGEASIEIAPRCL